MTSKELIQRSEEIYVSRLKAELERTHRDYFVVIEPESGDHFLGRTLSDASAAAHAVYPDRRGFALRVGHRAAVHIGAINS